MKRNNWDHRAHNGFAPISAVLLAAADCAAQANRTYATAGFLVCHDGGVAAIVLLGFENTRPRALRDGTWTPVASFR